MNRLTRKENVDYTTNAIIHTVGFTVVGDTNKDYNRALKKLYDLENIFELIDNLYKYPVYIKFEEGKIITETFNEENYDIFYNPRTNEIEVYYYESVVIFNPDNYKKTWWFKKDRSE